MCSSIMSKPASSDHSVAWAKHLVMSPMSASVMARGVALPASNGMALGAISSQA